MKHTTEQSFKIQKSCEKQSLLPANKKQTHACLKHLSLNTNVGWCNMTQYNPP